jgi:hypothetical protein
MNEPIASKIAERRMLPSLQDHPLSQQALAKYRNRLKGVLEQHFEVRAQQSLDPGKGRWLLKSRCRLW